MRQEGMDVARIIEIVLGVACIEEGSPPGPRENWLTLILSRHVDRAKSGLQELDVPGEALVQGRKIGFREGSHLANQLYHHMCQNYKDRGSSPWALNPKKKGVRVVKKANRVNDIH